MLQTRWLPLAVQIYGCSCRLDGRISTLRPVARYFRLSGFQDRAETKSTTLERVHDNYVSAGNTWQGNGWLDGLKFQTVGRVCCVLVSSVLADELQPSSRRRSGNNSTHRFSDVSDMYKCATDPTIAAGSADLWIICLSGGTKPRLTGQSLATSTCLAFVNGAFLCAEP